MNNFVEKYLTEEGKILYQAGFLRASFDNYRVQSLQTEDFINSNEAKMLDEAKLIVASVGAKTNQELLS